jgi:uncharacterized membrane protein YfcA
VIAGAGLGLVIGVLLGLLGGGESILAVPALVYGVGVRLAGAVPMSLLVVGVSSATALLPRLRRGQLSWRIAGVLGRPAPPPRSPGRRSAGCSTPGWSWSGSPR